MLGISWGRTLHAMVEGHLVHESRTALGDSLLPGFAHIQHPHWYTNALAHPEVELRDGGMEVSVGADHYRFPASVTGDDGE